MLLSFDSKNQEILKEETGWVFSCGMPRTHNCDFLFIKKKKLVYS